jgi:ribosome-associated protein
MYIAETRKRSRIKGQVLRMIDINSHTGIGDDELVFKASRSGGPGGQNVNKVNTRITLFFNVRDSASLSDNQKSRILSRLSGRIDRAGVLRIVSQRFRTQDANRRAAVERFRELLGEALKPTPVRKKTKASRGSRERRLSCKRHRGAVKRERTARDWLDE